MTPEADIAAASNLRLERPHSGAKPIFHHSGYSRLMGADEAPAKGTKPSKHRHAVAAAAGYRTLMNRI
jgi:hypothetical protein